MASSQRKQILLEQLAQTYYPISLPELLKKLPHDYAERSVRRWLRELADEHLIEIYGFKKSTKYQIIRQISETPENNQKYFSSESEQVIVKVRLPLYERKPTSYHTQWFDDYQPNHHFYLPIQLRNSLHQAGLRSDHEEPAGTYAHQIFNRLLIDLAYNSSRLEGNTYSLLDTERLLLAGKVPEGKLDEEKIMILNHKEAIRYLVDNAHRTILNQETICTLHYLLSDGLIDNKYAGKVRDHAVRIGGSTYLPLEESGRLLRQLNEIAQKAQLIQDPFEQSIFLLVHISYLQAFSDVNKRTARLCTNIPLIKNNLVPLSFKDVDRDDYMSAMIAVYELQEVRPIVDLYAYSYLRTCAAYDATIKTLGYDEIRVRYRQQRRDMLKEIILRGLHGSAIQAYIESKRLEDILEEEQAAFREDVLEDLEQIDASRISGLGITKEQFERWYHSQ